MSDIGLKGVAGLILLLAAAGIGLLWLVAGTIWAAAVASRGTAGFGQAFARSAAGPLATLFITGATVAWAWNGPTDAVDQVGPIVAPLSVVVGVVVALLARRRQGPSGPNPRPGGSRADLRQRS